MNMMKLIIEWGITTFKGEQYKDAKVWSTSLKGEGAVEWNWKNDCTNHTDGITREAVTELLGCGADTIILTTGFDDKLNNPEELIEWLDGMNFKVLSMNTRPGVEMYNYLVSQNENVAGLFHSTC